MEKTPKKFHLEIGAPAVVTQGTVGDQAWGHYSFPSIKKTEKGHILVAWEYGRDDIDYKAAPEGVVVNKVSEDNGKTFRLTRSDDKMESSHQYADKTVFQRMKNGKDFVGFQVKGAHRAEYVDKYTPAHEGKGKRHYFVADIVETEDTAVYAMERDPITGKEEAFECRINWPYATIHSYVSRGLLYPYTMTFALHAHRSIFSVDGDMYIAVYTYAPDAEAKTREEAIHKYMDYCGCYVFKSTDCGRTWDYLSQILVDDDTFNPKQGFEGLDEPYMSVMPDGSVTMLIRTGSSHPSYITHSADMCRSWSKPTIFDDCGVFPCLLPLSCGVTLASYGRPVLKVRATADPAGMVWEDPIQLPLYGMHKENHMERSCFYTQMVAMDDDRALLVYTDFQYPNADGEPAKAVCVREIRVVLDE